MLTLMMVAACGAGTPPVADVTGIVNTEDDSLEIVGTVSYVELEGGFFGIVGDDGARYDPINLDESFAIAGLRVKAKIRLRPDLMGFHMWGQIVEIVRMESL